MFDPEAIQEERELARNAEVIRSNPANREWRPMPPCRLKLCDGSGWVPVEKRVFNRATQQIETASAAVRCECSRPRL